MLHKQRGQALIVITVTLMALLGMLALVVDTGRAYIEHARLQRAVDAASLAAVQDLPEDVNSAEQFAKEAFELNHRETVDKYQITFIGPPKTPEKVNTAIVTSQKTVNNQLAHFLGYPDWPITAQSAARSGPIGAIQHWIPIGVEEGEIELYQHYRLGNTSHTPADSSDLKRMYVPLDHGNIRQGVSNTINSTLYVGNNLPISTNSDIRDVCRGIDDRMRQRISVRGCFEVTSQVDPVGLNIVGPGMRKDWNYGEDPRLVYVPFVKQINGNTVQITGFGLFYIEYAHYDDMAMGASEPLTEVVGFFVKTVVEGPVLNDNTNYGVVGIEYVDLDKLVP